MTLQEMAMKALEFLRWLASHVRRLASLAFERSLPLLKQPGRAFLGGGRRFDSTRVVAVTILTLIFGLLAAIVPPSNATMFLLGTSWGSLIPLMVSRTV